MKKVLIGIGIAAALVASVIPTQAQGLYQEVTVICTNGGTAYSDALAVGGYLDKIEYIKGGAATQTFTIATFSGTTAIDTFATKQLAGATQGVIRPRTIGTTTAGVALSASTTYGIYATNAFGQPISNLVATTSATIPYERFRIGGNTKIYVSSDSEASGSAKSTNTFRIYLVPYDR